MVIMSANSSNFSGAYFCSSARIEYCETDSPVGAKWLS
jgi:hypothetical protein